MPKTRKTRKEKIMSLNRQNAAVNDTVFTKVDILSSPAHPTYTLQPSLNKPKENQDIHFTKDLIKTTILTLSVIIGELILFYVLQLHK